MAENSTDDNSKLVDMDDLDDFSDMFFSDEAEVEKVDVIDHGNGEIEEVDTPEEDEIAETEDDTLATEEESEDEGEDEEEAAAEPEPEPKKKNRTQERIERLVAEARQAERERDLLVRRLEELEAKTRVEVKASEQLAADPTAPQPDAVDDKGNPVYELGEFDPKFIRDLTKFTIEQETSAMKAQAAKEAQELEVRQAQAKLRQEWTQKVEEYSQEVPDYQEDVQSLDKAFRGIEPQYGEYLASTIMQCDNGPEIMHYLSQNIGEAQSIVASGPFAATLAIGRLQARLEKPKQEEKRNIQKVSEAPPPPDTRVRGKGGQFAIRPDTDDLDAFEKDFFKKR